ncbi:MAG TPA: cupin domain-containing protein [Chitinophagaceae bacterium]|nr:cupin domain-containing protein [Chitinophagaceae bacterium]
MKTSIYQAPRYLWGNHCEGWPLLETEGLVVKQESMPPGTAERMHRHREAQQFFYILQGQGEFRLEGQPYLLSQGEGIHVAAGLMHDIRNRSGSPLSFLVISQPSSAQDRENGPE